jgi:hypothetical protein
MLPRALAVLVAGSAGEGVLPSDQAPVLTPARMRAAGTYENDLNASLIVGADAVVKVSDLGM